MNTNEMNNMELNLEEMEQVNGGGLFNIIKKIGEKVFEEIKDLFD